MVWLTFLAEYSVSIPKMWWACLTERTYSIKQADNNLGASGW